MTKIKVLLSNRTATLSHINSEDYQKLRDFWAFSPDGLWFMPRYQPYKVLHGQRQATFTLQQKLSQSADAKNQRRAKRLAAQIASMDKKLDGLWDGKLRFLNNYRLPAGLYRATRLEAALKCDVEFDVERRRTHLDFVQGIPDSNDAQYKHQDIGVRQMMQMTERGGGTILSATGTGKTRIAAMYFSRVTVPCLFVVDQIQLLYQQAEELKQWLGQKVGVIGDTHFDPTRVTVATVQTLARHTNNPKFRAWYDSVQVMVVDEMHEQLNRSNFDVLNRINPIAIFGMTATLQMKKKMVRYKVFAFSGPVIFEFLLQKGIKRGVLSDVAALQLLFPSVSAEADYQEELRQEVLENEEKLSAAESITKYLMERNRYVTILTQRKQHIQKLSEDVFSKVEHGLAYGDVEVADRQKSIEAFEDGAIRLLLASGVFKKGINIKRLDTVIDMAEMKSRNDAVQKLGRALRLHKDKGISIYIDFGTQIRRFQDVGRFSTNAYSRRRALKQAGIDMKTVKVDGAEHALQVVKKFLKGLDDGKPRTAKIDQERSGSLFAASQGKVAAH